MLVIGTAGGTGSGKSTIAQRIEEQSCEEHLISTVSHVPDCC